ncbi:hypothetical protein [Paenibacillus swuensis]|uniref:hypothetical protein n=1 Tax=Paenibacillus swuensis TaxID=1178515 RepID=UPI000B262EFA|nr:hypothetical protein [Paenibacillus swuensis]
MKDDKNRVIKREELEESQQTGSIIPSKEAVSQAAMEVMKRHREVLERLAKN